ncbi:MAG: Gfo/Idh/MocA family oxidoreductase [Eubacteriales bacterium]|nr:Gfo/Idh/MocA family oxidoreductase [Eubacteriales bacterium]
MEKLKIAVIGCGTIANAQHLPSYTANPKAELVSVCDIIPERADAAKEKYGAKKAVYDYHDVLNDPEVQAVSICVHNYMHAPMAIDFLKAGKDVLCEKPAAVTYDLVCDMKAAADANDRILNIGVVNRFNSNVNRVRDIIQSGELGELYQIYCSFRAHRSIPGLGGQSTRKETAGGGVLIDWGVHYLDLIFYCIGEVRLKTVTGATHSVLGKDMPGYTYESMWAGPPDYAGVYNVEEYVTGMVRTTGPVITLNGAWAQNIGEDATFIEFMGSKGGVKLTYGGDFILYSTDRGCLTATQYKGQCVNMFAHEIDCFIDAVNEHKKIRSNVDQVLITAQVMQGLYDSAETGHEISY